MALVCGLQPENQETRFAGEDGKGGCGRLDAFRLSNRRIRGGADGNRAGVLEQLGVGDGIGLVKRIVRHQIARGKRRREWRNRQRNENDSKQLTEHVAESYIKIDASVGFRKASPMEVFARKNADQEKQRRSAAGAEATCMWDWLAQATNLSVLRIAPLRDPPNDAAISATGSRGADTSV